MPNSVHCSNVLAIYLSVAAVAGLGEFPFVTVAMKGFSLVFGKGAAFDGFSTAIAFETGCMPRSTQGLEAFTG